MPQSLFHGPNFTRPPAPPEQPTPQAKQADTGPFPSRAQGPYLASQSFPLLAQAQPLAGRGMGGCRVLSQCTCDSFELMLQSTEVSIGVVPGPGPAGRGLAQFAGASGWHRSAAQDGYRRVVRR